MILLDIMNNLKKELLVNEDSLESINENNIVLKFINNFDNLDKINNEIIEKNSLSKNETFEIKCHICDFLGSGSYGKVYKIRIKKKYYALKISENEKPNNLKLRYESLINIDQLKKYVIKIHLAGNIDCGKYKYFSIMEYGGSSLKSKIPLSSSQEVIFVMRQLYNIVYLCSKYRLYLTDFKFNNIVVCDLYRLRLIDIYMDCKSYEPCKECKIVKTYSTIEMDKIKNILDDKDYKHTYHLIPLGVGLIDLLCKKSASHIIGSLANNFSINLSLKQMIPLIQLANYNYIHKTNTLIKEEYHPVYKIKKKIEKKFPIVRDEVFYKTFLSLIEVRDEYKNVIPSSKLHTILHGLFSAYPDDRTLEPLKKFLNDKN
jgi:serine/threonine protein kinase